MADASQNGELQEVIRKGRMPEIQSIAVCFYSNTMRSLDAQIISESFKISRQLLLGNCRGANINHLWWLNTRIHAGVNR